MPNLLYLDDAGVATLKTLIGQPTDEQVTTAVHNELVAHPEWVTTVRDGSITGVKIADDTIPDAKLAQTGGVLEKVDSIFSDTPVATSIREIAGATAYMGHNGTVNNNPGGISISTATPGYDSYLIVTTQDMDIWFDTISVNYLALTWGTAYTKTVDMVGTTGVIAKCSNPVRLRTSDGNLPTEQNKLHVPAGSAVCFTLPQNKEQTVYGFASETAVKETFADEVLSYGESDKLIVQYRTGPERVNVYKPTSVGYVLYDFRHVDNTANNADIWHVAVAYAMSDMETVRYQVTTGGEWEIAVHLTDRDDFSGGSAHGDQKLIGDPVFMVDGVIKTLSDLATATECREFVVLQTSNMYDPADHETVIAIEACQHKWSVEGLEVKQSLHWQGAYTLTTSYLAMFPVAKAVTDYAYLDSDMAVNAIADMYGNHTDTQWACVYGASNGLRCEFWVDEYPNVSGERFLMTDNGGGAYNKCYYVAAASNAVTPPQVTADTIWMSTTHYRIEVGA